MVVSVLGCGEADRAQRKSPVRIPAGLVFGSSAPDGLARNIPYRPASGGRNKGYYERGGAAHGDCIACGWPSGKGGAVRDRANHGIPCA